MIITTKELIKRGETQYSIKQKLTNKEIKLIRRGVYSFGDENYISEGYICRKYPNVVITGISAFSIYNLTDYIPKVIHVASRQHSYPINIKEIKQSYQSNRFFNVGVTTILFKDEEIKIYDLERLLIELIRLKETYSKDLYYDVLESFRKIKYTLDFYKISEYVKKFNNPSILLSKIKELI